MTDLIMPTDGPRASPRTPEQVNANVRAELDKATETWGIPNNLARTMACHPRLAQTEIDYVNSFIFDENVFGEIPRPGNLEDTVLFPQVGFVDRVTKELVIAVVSLINRSRYSITHHAVISWGVLAERVAGATAAERAKRAEAMLLNTVDGTGVPVFLNQTYEGKPLFTPLQTAAMTLAVSMNRSGHDVTDDEFDALRDAMRDQARADISVGPLAFQFDASGPDKAYLDAYVDGMLIELTWCIAHYGGLLNRWFTALKVRDEEYDVAPGKTFPANYNDAVPESIKVRNNQLLGLDGWGAAPRSTS